MESDDWEENWQTSVRAVLKSNREKTAKLSGLFHCKFILSVRIMHSAKLLLDSYSISHYDKRFSGLWILPATRTYFYYAVKADVSACMPWTQACCFAWQEFLSCLVLSVESRTRLTQNCSLYHAIRLRLTSDELLQISRLELITGVEIYINSDKAIEKLWRRMPVFGPLLEYKA